MSGSVDGDEESIEERQESRGKFRFLRMRRGYSFRENERENSEGKERSSHEERRAKFETREETKQSTELGAGRHSLL